MYSQNMPLPLSQWTHHVDPLSKRPFIANPVTKEVRWLYTRFLDGKTGRDYLVNVVTNQSIWATRENNYLCPVPAVLPPAPALSKPEPIARVANASDNPYLLAGNVRPGGRSEGSGIERNGPLPAPSGARKDIPHQIIETIPSIGLDRDEVISQAPSGRKFIYNKRTRQSRWLSQEVKSDLKKEKLTSGKMPQNAHSMAPPSSRNESIDPRISSDDAAINLQRAVRGFQIRRKNIVSKLRSLASTREDVTLTVSDGAKYDLSVLRYVLHSGSSPLKIPNRSVISKKEANQRLLELDEYLTQKNLVVDGVDSAGDSIVRMKRKEAVTLIQGLIDQVDVLRKEGKAAC